MIVFTIAYLPAMSDSEKPDSKTYYARSHADGLAGREMNAHSDDWTLIEAYADGYEDGKFTAYRQARDAETPLGFAHEPGERPLNETARHTGIRRETLE
jgi:hypothetical protein